MHWALPLLFATMCLSAWGLTFAQLPPAARDAGELAEAALGEPPGIVSVGVLRGGRIQVAVRRRERLAQPEEKVDGPAPGAEPIFEIGSVSKVFKGLLVAQRVERGELRLDDTIGQLLQGHVAFRYEAASRIIIRQLVTHSSCLRRWPAGFTAERMFDQASKYGQAGLRSTMTDFVLGRTPPCETRYSNVAYALLGEILAQRSQRPWESLLVESIAQPLVLRDTRLHLTSERHARVAPPWNGALRSQAWTSGVFAPAGGLHSTATDLVRAQAGSRLHARRVPWHLRGGRRAPPLCPRQTCAGAEAAIFHPDFPRAGPAAACRHCIGSGDRVSRRAYGRGEHDHGAAGAYALMETPGRMQVISGGARDAFRIGCSHLANLR